MRKNKDKIVLSLIAILSVITIGINTYAHSGRTDSYGGHRDNKNKSGLGSYHYHCGGYPAHLHTNGVCPYSSSSSSSKSSSYSSSYSSKKNTTTVAVTGIEINEDIESIEVGKSITLTAKITPSNASNKEITWKSSNQDIATVSSSGKVVAKKSGKVSITATASNGKKSTIKIRITEKSKEKDVTMSKISTINTNTTTNNSEGSDSSGGFWTWALLGGAGFWGYKKLKKE